MRILYNNKQYSFMNLKLIYIKKNNIMYNSESHLYLLNNKRLLNMKNINKKYDKMLKKSKYELENKSIKTNQFFLKSIVSNIFFNVIMNIITKFINGDLESSIQILIQTLQ